MEGGKSEQIRWKVSDDEGGKWVVEDKRRWKENGELRWPGMGYFKWTRVRCKG